MMNITGYYLKPYALRDIEWEAECAFTNANPDKDFDVTAYQSGNGKLNLTIRTLNEDGNLLKTEYEEFESEDEFYDYLKTI